MDLSAILGQVHFFSGLSPESRRALAECCIPRDVPKRTVLFHEGEDGHSMYLLNRGSIRLHKTAADGADVVIKVARPGEVFAEVVLFEAAKFPVTATALTESTVFLFPRRALRGLLRRDEFRDDFIAMLMRKQRYLAQRIVYLTTSDVEDRLLHFLREQYGEGPVFRVTISKKEVAAAIGATPETLSRLLLRLQQAGRMTWKGRSVQLLPPKPAAPVRPRRPTR